MAAATIPTEMDAVVLVGPGEVAIERRPVPEPGPGQVLIEVAACGICGTDLHLALDGWGAPGTVPGHEYAGRIAVLGAGVTGLAVGQEVTANPQPGCGTCAGCLAGRPSLCRSLDLMGATWQGAFAGYLAAPAPFVHPLPVGMPVTRAALAEPVAVALHALTRAEVAPGERVLVTGAGPLGLLLVALLRARGVDEVVVSEPIAARREQALAVGAAAVIEPADLPDPLIPPLLVAEPFQRVLECSGKPQAIEAGLKVLAPGGRLVIVGSGIEPAALDHTRMLVHELEIVGALNYDLTGFEDALAVLDAAVLPLEHLVEPDVVPLGRFLETCQDLAAGRLRRKVLIAP